MIRFLLPLGLFVLLSACGSPRAPAPVVMRGDEPLSPPSYDETIPDAAPVEPVDSMSLEPLEPTVSPQSSVRPDFPVRKMASIPFDAQAVAARNSASGAAAGLASVAENIPLVPSPDQVEVVPARIRPASIEVGKGETLFSISEKYQIALKPLIAENNLKAPYALNAGQTLKLPAPLHYRVRAGDTVMAISRRFSLDFRSLALINGIEPPFALRTNELLILPALARGADGQWKSAVAIKPKVPGVRPGGTKPAVKPQVRAPAKTSTFAWPLQGSIVSGFGVKPGGTRNDGINISAPAGTAIRAAGAGTVVYAGSELKSFGNLILIRHPNGWVSAYAHNSKLLVKEGAKIKTGDSIAKVGATGSVSTPQLHFETRRGRDPVNPMLHLPKRS